MAQFLQQQKKKREGEETTVDLKNLRHILTECNVQTLKEKPS